MCGYGFENYLQFFCIQCCLYYLIGRSQCADGGMFSRSDGGSQAAVGVS